MVSSAVVECCAARCRLSVSFSALVASRASDCRRTDGDDGCCCTGVDYIDGFDVTTADTDVDAIGIDHRGSCCRKTFVCYSYC